MTLHQVGQLSEARKTFATASLSEDWRSVNARDNGVWISHVLRREAERLILPNLPSFRRGEYQPQDNDERLALLAGQIANCEFEGFQSAAVRAYSEVFATEPSLADNLPTGIRFQAARAAALAGCREGKDPDGTSEEHRDLMRRQALDWLRQDLTMCDQQANESNAQAHALIRQRLQNWRSDPALDAVRADDSLAKLPSEERRRWTQFWSEVDALARRLSQPK
jgi:serine/threonine-protein kinase